MNANKRSQSGGAGDLAAAVHKCPISGCERMVGREFLMCPAHWGIVPPAVQKVVWREYKRRPQSQAHLCAMELAVKCVERAQTRE